jgi:hypothetical protein
MTLSVFLFLLLLHSPFDSETASLILGDVDDSDTPSLFSPLSELEEQELSSERSESPEKKGTKKGKGTDSEKASERERTNSRKEKGKERGRGREKTKEKKIKK